MLYQQLPCQGLGPGHITRRPQGPCKLNARRQVIGLLAQGLFNLFQGLVMAVQRHVNSCGDEQGIGIVGGDVKGPPQHDPWPGQAFDS